MADNWTILEEIQTECQQIRLLRSEFEIEGEYRLLLTCDEYFQVLEGPAEENYHRAITQEALEKTKEIGSKYLILGGGDFCVARDLLKNNENAEITLVDYDKGMTDFCATDERMINLNKRAFEKCNIYNEDALLWVKKDDNKYDIIILDLPDKTNEVLAKLYDEEFLSDVNSLLNINGVASMQCNWDYEKEMFIKFKNIFNNVIKIEYDMPYMYGGIILIGEHKCNRA